MPQAVIVMRIVKHRRREVKESHPLRIQQIEYNINNDNWWNWWKALVEVYKENENHAKLLLSFEPFTLWIRFLNTKRQAKPNRMVNVIEQMISYKLQ